MRKVVFLSLLVTYFFFFEYLRPVHSMHTGSDLEEYYYPLADYAYQAIHQGRFPLWDPSVYTGMSFLANAQTELFYPPAWLMFALRWNQARLSHQAMQDLMTLHIWLAFILAYVWLRGKRLQELAAVIGAGVFAYSGWMCTWIQHIGSAAAFAWVPLGLWGIDQAVEERSWRPLWKLALSSALCFLSGYPPAWFTFVVLCAVYALAGAWRWKAALGAGLAGLLSLGLIAVQALHTLEGARLREPELRYDGILDPVLLLDFLTPNFMDVSMKAHAPDDVFAAYYYLGVPALLAIPMLLYTRRRQPWRDMAPAAALLLASIAVVTNPFNLVGGVVSRSIWSEDLARNVNFLAGVTLAFAPLTAFAVDAFLKRPGGALRPWMPSAIIAGLALWMGFDLYRWFGPGFPVGWDGWYDIAGPLALFAGGLAVVRSASGRMRIAVATAVVLFLAVNYKVMGTSKRFNSAPGPGATYSTEHYFAMDDEAFRALETHPRERILIDTFGPLPARLRHIGLQTPQGYDPFLSQGLRQFLRESGAQFSSEREFQIDPDKTELLQRLGVRYVISADEAPMFSKLKGNPRFRHVGTWKFFYQVFEYLDARPAYAGPGTVSLTGWTPEQRAFSVKSDGGEFVLAEQYHPAWKATVDGAAVNTGPWKSAFITAQIPAGEHVVVFMFQPQWKLGAAISLISLAVLAAWSGLASSRPRKTRPSPR